jgi:hypothetical protein
MWVGVEEVHGEGRTIVNFIQVADKRDKLAINETLVAFVENCMKGVSHLLVRLLGC